MHKALLKGGGEGRCTQPYIPQMEKLILGLEPVITRSSGSNLTVRLLQGSPFFYTGNNVENGMHMSQSSKFYMKSLVNTCETHNFVTKIVLGMTIIFIFCLVKYLYISSYMKIFLETCCHEV